MPSNDDVINRSPVWYSGLPFILSPRSVLLITPFHRRNSKNFVGRDSRTNSRKPPSPRLLQTWLWYSYSEEFCLWVLRVPSLSANTLTQHTFILAHTLWSIHTPRKIPGPFTSSVHKSPPTHLLLQGETFPKRGEKHLVVISFPLFFKLHFSPPLHSISNREKTNSER